MVDRLKVDLEALGRLCPQVKELAQAIQGDAASSAGSASGGTDPALAAIASLTSRTLPNTEKIVAGWMNVFAEVCEAGRQGFIANEEHGVALMKSVPTLGRAG
ncbi:hypothetical protein [Mycobacteroides abscessus]|uniref:hypothetical protein n=1 Tax=Mycobacteroides abscessus TaxID=36809 RepID=UPI000C25A808|nr:hypothetical protein [Mycobacteroides abscessus]